jgi:hypothetical protein
MLFVRRSLRRQDRTGKPEPAAVFVDPPVVDPRLADLYRPHAGLKLTLVLVAVANHQATPLLIPQILVGSQVGSDLRLDGPRQQLLSPLPQNPRQRVLTRNLWKTNPIRRTLIHGVSSVNG